VPRTQINKKEINDNLKKNKKLKRSPPKNIIENNILINKI
jgi:hypothetical protein